MHAPIVLLLGHTNVGKSTLFNTLLRKKSAITYDQPGITRDIRAEHCTIIPGHECILIDSPGFHPFKNQQHLSIHPETLEALKEQIQSADIIVFVTDCLQGLDKHDKYWLRYCEKAEANLVLCINKCDLADPITSCYSFQTSHIVTVSCLQKTTIQTLKSLLASIIVTRKSNRYSQPSSDDSTVNYALQNHNNNNNCLTHNSIMLMGKPNVGKSTLTNQLVGAHISTASQTAGTTRDIVTTSFSWRGKSFTLMDTAGIRRASKLVDPIEKLSVGQVLQALKMGVDVIALLIDANEGITDQDFKLIRLILQARTRICIVVNKWDLLSASEKNHRKKTFQDALSVFPSLPLVYISASKRLSINPLIKVLTKVLATTPIMPSSHLTKLLYKAIETHPPPAIDGRRIKPRFAHSIGNRFKIIITGNQVELLPKSYQRYLVNFFQKHLGLLGIDIIIVLSNKHNPYNKDS